MLLTIVVYATLWLSSTRAHQQCMLGHMTDVQDWVTKDGNLTGQGSLKRGADMIDLSGSPDALEQLQRILRSNLGPRGAAIQQLSLAKCGLKYVPQVFQLRDSQGRSLASSLRHLTLYGNNFHASSEPRETYEASLNATDAVLVAGGINDSEYNQSWAVAFQVTEFRYLQELDLRSCRIRTIKDNTFERMRLLRYLYLGENMIVHIEEQAFHGLPNLLHLDLSNNDIEVISGSANYIQIDSVKVFESLKKLEYLDLSSTKITQANVGIFRWLSNSLEKLSICNIGITSLGNHFFNESSLKYLDVSGNSQILNVGQPNFIEHLSKQLVVLYADNVGLSSLNVLCNFYNLQVLKVSNNTIDSVPNHVTTTWRSLKILDLTSNRIPSWFGTIYKNIPNLILLSLIKNNMNMISEAMILDLDHVTYVGLSQNYFVCTCQVRLFLNKAIQSEILINKMQTSEPLLTGTENAKNKSKDQIESLELPTGWTYFQDIVDSRVKPKNLCNSSSCVDEDDLTDTALSYLLFDYDKYAYRCYAVNGESKNAFTTMQNCQNLDRNIPYDAVVEDQIATLIALVCVPLLVFAVIAVIMFRTWWCVKYFCITMKNSAMLSLIGNEKKEAGDAEGVYHYDVFVSYCHEDRAWVLDRLLPQVEAEPGVSVCLHERDFQVGLSILENIVSCMDRSRAIVLVISERFLASQWCQFEMHLAQHRLLETRREDLLLVLLEEIPRRRRPHTLHYLMLTKTYIVWPESPAGRDQFWRRLKRSLASSDGALRGALPA